MNSVSAPLVCSRPGLEWNLDARRIHRELRSILLATDFEVAQDRLVRVHFRVFPPAAVDHGDFATTKVVAWLRRGVSNLVDRNSRDTGDLASEEVGHAAASARMVDA